MFFYPHNIILDLNKLDMSDPIIVENLKKEKKYFWKRRSMETTKSAIRRKLEGWFDKYTPFHLPGIDIGCGYDPIHPSFVKYDKIFGAGDAQFMEDIPNESFDTVFASHVLEHLNDPIIGLQNWHRICKPGGHIIICVPHRDLYEKRIALPSKWNEDHKTFWLPEKDKSRGVFGVKETVHKAIPAAKIVLLRVLNEGWVSNGQNHSDGEYSIECVIRKQTRKLYM